MATIEPEQGEESRVLGSGLLFLEVRALSIIAPCPRMTHPRKPKIQKCRLHAVTGDHIPVQRATHLPSSRRHE